MKENPRWKLKGKMRETVIDELRRGVPVPTLAIRNGAAQSTIRRLAKMAGIKTVRANRSGLEQHDEEIRRLAESHNPDEIALILRRRKTTVRDYMNRRGIEFKRCQRNRWTPEKVEQARALALQGLTCKQVAAEFKVGLSVMYLVARRNGISFRANHWLTQEKLNTLHRLWLKGWGIKAAARKVDGPVATVRHKFDQWRSVATPEEKAQRARARAGDRLACNTSTAQGEAA